MSFNNIIEQDAAVRVLQDELRSGRINHAYLFTGKKGVGKKKLAFQFARSLFCKENKADSCDECSDCKKIDHFNHPDVQLIERGENEKKIKIAQIRALQKNISFKPYEGERKVYIIDDADKMTLQAANCLLKTLEEPPAYAVLILLASEVNRLLSTVISRCQRIRLYNISREKIMEELLLRNVEEERAELISGLAGGSFDRACSLVEDEDFIEDRNVVMNILEEIPEMNTVELVKGSEKLERLLDDDFPVFNLLFCWYRDLILYLCENSERLMNVDYRKSIIRQAGKFNLDELSRIVKLIDDYQSYIERNVRSDLAFIVLLLKIRSKRV